MALGKECAKRHSLGRAERLHSSLVCRSPAACSFSCRDACCCCLVPHSAVDVIKSAMMTDSIDPAQRKYPTIPSTAKVSQQLDAQTCFSPGPAAERCWLPALPAAACRVPACRPSNACLPCPAGSVGGRRPVPLLPRLLALHHACRACQRCHAVHGGQG